jgi:isopenicillin N synthase-like dioxygenase
VQQLDQLLPAPPRGRDLAAALERDGYLTLSSPPALARRIAELWQAGEAFFALPRERKLLNALPEYDGYHDIGKEYSDRPDRPDLAESFWARLIHADATARLPDAEGVRRQGS